MKKPFKLFDIHKNKPLFALVFFLFQGNFLCYAQNILSGTIKDKQNAPIPYANIWIKSSLNAVVANENGKFEVITNPSVPNDTLFASHLGFKKSYLILPQKNPCEIILENNYIQLSEISIIALNEADLIRKIKAKIPQNYPIVGSINSVYFNYEVKNDNLFLSYFDGNLNLNADSYLKTGSLQAKLLNFSINLNNFDKISDFSYISPKTIASYAFPLNLPFLQHETDYKYHVAEFSSEGASFYKIDFEPKNVLKKWQYSGDFTVNIKDYAIVEAKFSLVENIKNKNTAVSVGFSTSKTITTSSLEEFFVSYKPKNNRYYNSFLKYNSAVSLYDSKLNSNRNITIKSVLMTNTFNDKPTEEDKKAGKPFNLYGLKTQNGDKKQSKNRYLGTDWEEKIKMIKEANPELNE